MCVCACVAWEGECWMCGQLDAAGAHVCCSVGITQPHAPQGWEGRPVCTGPTWSVCATVNIFDVCVCVFVCLCVCYRPPLDGSLMH